MKNFLPSVFALFVSVSLNAIEEGSSRIFIKNATIEGIEYIYEEENAPAEIQDTQDEISSDESPFICITGDSLIYGIEHLFFANQSARKTLQKNNFSAKKKITLPARSSIAEKAPTNIFPAFHSKTSHSYHIKYDEESAIVDSQHRLHQYQPINKLNRGNTYLYIYKSAFSLCSPEQRQRKSITATQCGMLTSFSPNSPSLFCFHIKK